MNTTELITTLRNQSILPIFRGTHEEIRTALKLMKPLALTTIELTTSIPDWQTLLKELSTQYQVGLGTVKTDQDISDAKSNGAKFLVSFGSFTDLIEANSEIPVIPGAMTPSEFLNLQRAGIKLAKLYPASIFGPKYLKDLKVLLPEMNFIVTGGIGITSRDFQTWISAGADAIGMGSSLGNPIIDPIGFTNRVHELKLTLGK